MRTNLQSHNCCNDGSLVSNGEFASQEETPSLGKNKVAVACTNFREAVIG